LKVGREFFLTGKFGATPSFLKTHSPIIENRGSKILPPIFETLGNIFGRRVDPPIIEILQGILQGENSDFPIYI
jgi:hypothetical protein